MENITEFISIDNPRMREDDKQSSYDEAAIRGAIGECVGIYTFRRLPEENRGNSCVFDLRSEGFRWRTTLFTIYDSFHYNGKLRIEPNKELRLNEVVAMCKRDVYGHRNFPKLSFINKDKTKVIDESHLGIDTNDFVYWSCRELENTEILSLAKYGLKDFYVLILRDNYEKNINTNLVPIPNGDMSSRTGQSNRCYRWRYYPSKSLWRIHKNPRYRYARNS